MGPLGTLGMSGHLLAAVGDMELAASWVAGASVELLPGLRDGEAPQTDPLAWESCFFHAGMGLCVDTFFLFFFSGGSCYPGRSCGALCLGNGA